MKAQVWAFFAAAFAQRGDGAEMSAVRADALLVEFHKRFPEGGDPRVAHLEATVSALEEQTKKLLLENDELQQENARLVAASEVAPNDARNKEVASNDFQDNL